MSDINSSVHLDYTASDKGVTATTDKISKSITDAGRKAQTSAVQTLHSMRSILASVTYLQSSATTAFRVLTHVTGTLLHNTENLRMSLAANAALITTFAKPGQGDLGDVYKKAYMYSAKVQEKMVEINGQTVGNLHQMDLVYREFLKQGVQIDINKKKQLDAFAVITNAVGILTAGMPNQNIQYSQEIRSVMEGVARPGTTLALVLKSKLGANWADTLKQWDKAGVLLEKLAGQLKGFEAGASTLATTWTVVASTVVSWLQWILGKGFEPLYDFIITKVKILDKWLSDNKDKILVFLVDISRQAAYLLEGINWESFRNTLASILVILVAIIGLKLAVNIANIAVALNALKLAFVEAGFAAKGFAMILTKFGWVGLTLAVVGIAYEVGKLAFAWTEAGKKAAAYKREHPASKTTAEATIASITKTLKTAKSGQAFSWASEKWFNEQGLQYGQAKDKDYYKTKEGIMLTNAGQTKLSGLRSALKANMPKEGPTEMVQTQGGAGKEPNSEEIDKARFIAISKSLQDGANVTPQDLEWYTANVKKYSPTFISHIPGGAITDPEAQAKEWMTPWERFADMLSPLVTDLASTMDSAFTDLFDNLLAGVQQQTNVWQTFAQSVADGMRATFAKILASFIETFVITNMLNFLGSFIGMPTLGNFATGVSKGAERLNFNDSNKYISESDFSMSSVTPKASMASTSNAVSKTSETNSILMTMTSKLDAIGKFAQEKGQIIIGDSQLKVLSSAIYKSQYRAQEMGIA